LDSTPPPPTIRIKKKDWCERSICRILWTVFLIVPKLLKKWGIRIPQTHSLQFYVCHW
jgi:hypothetical protein